MRSKHLGSGRVKSTRKLALFYAFAALALYGTLDADPQGYAWAPETSLPFSPILQSSPDKGRLNEVTLVRSNVKHGYFLFGYDSHQVQIPANETIQRTWTPAQTRLLNDHEINLTREEARCQSYGYALPPNPRRRRLFMGALVADDSLEVLSAVSAEAYDIFHTVAFVESNTTFTGRTPRGFRFGPGSGRQHELYQLFGPGTKVSVDYYVSVPNDKIGERGNAREVLQRDAVQRRWHKNGMRPDDVAIFMDSDEAFTRDFLRAMQICDVPNFRPGQDCMAPKILASTLVFESSPECITKGRRWYHPDAVVGECVELIGNSTIHPHAKRQYQLNGKEESVGLRVPGQGMNVWTRGGSYSDFKTGPYPLWTAEDIRTGAPGTSKTKAGNLPTGYHFHNFFEDAHKFRFKYSTYGEPMPSMYKPIWKIHPDVALAWDCATNEMDKIEPFAVGENAEAVRPIYYLDDDARRRRHVRWKFIVEGEKERFEGKWRAWRRRNGSNPNGKKGWCFENGVVVRC
eukprot:CAMPEP_0172549354 /NCGR_PEP_ID=MMETSP1067-20121228/18469_1 /TAXON_ID=265564 ORGANISM="Thalassiosira punctigera, Strain Tpunct2005C2" /NCGR_SAMPLE_ID=MMETSP1067 /ASSEMBLY_ACC=CAM_ASM_000444 /LENGTH=514 /DNA_ID=CAMNT_0013336733 /DNA_START=60 /DNA_END=1604 /DNA_ORIENTATION=+